MLRNKRLPGFRGPGTCNDAAYRPAAAHGANNSSRRQRPCAPPAAQQTPRVLAASVAPVQSAQGQRSWLPPGFNLAHLPRPDLSWLEGNQAQEATLQELQGAQQVVLRQLVELEQQLAAAEAAEAAELQHLAATATPTTTTITTTTTTMVGTTTAAAASLAAAPLASATISSHIADGSSTQQQAAVEGMQLVRWADALITQHLGRSKTCSAAVSGDSIELSQQAKDAALLQAGLDGAVVAAHRHTLESAEGMQLVRWSQALINRRLEQRKAGAAGVLDELRQQWEDELARFRVEGERVLLDLAALQQQHLQLAASAQEHPLLPQLGRTLADIRVLASVAAAAVGGGKPAKAVCEAPPAAASEQLVAAGGQLEADNHAMRPSVAEADSQATQWLATSAPSAFTPAFNPSFHAWASAETPMAPAPSAAAPTAIAITPTVTAPAAIATIHVEPSTVAPVAISPTITATAAIATIHVEPPMVAAVAISPISTATAAIPPAATATILKAVHEDELSIAGRGLAAEGQPAEAEAARLAPPAPPAWDVVGQLLQHYLRQRRSVKSA